MEHLEQFAADLAGWVWSLPLFLILLGVGLAFSIATKFVQWRVVTHGLDCIRGKFDCPDDPGQINHFQALSAALSATIGLGNIAGVALAIQLGGPGAVFWMWVVGLLGMSLKYVECALAVMFRDERDVPDPSAPALMEADAEGRTLRYAGEKPARPGTVPRARGEVRGGPMWYIRKGLAEPLKERGHWAAPLFGGFAILFACLTVLASFGGGNSFQAWNVGDILRSNFSVPTWLSGAIVSTLVAMVIIGGIKRIGSVASRLVPFMCILYVFSAFYIIAINASEVPRLIALIFTEAFTPAAGEGAFMGTTVWMAFRWGLRRALFSNEAGQGSAPIAHAAARTDEPIREGVVAGIGPLIDTILICTMTALVLLISGTWNRAPVGTVGVIDGNAVHVAINPELPEQKQEQYVRELKLGGLLDVYIEEKFSAEPVTVKLGIAGLGPDSDQVVWTSSQEIVLDTSELTEEERAEIAVGQKVHLSIDGADMTRFAFDAAYPGFGKLMVTAAVVLFAFSTMISWSYYGEKGAEFLLGPRAILPYKFVFVIVIFLAHIGEKFSTVYDLSDAFVGMMALCNLPAALLLLPAVMRAAKDYFKRLDSGQMPKNK